MWRDRILEAKREKDVRTKTIAAFVRMSEKTVARILSGETQAPYVDTVIALGASVGLTPEEIFAETGVVVGDQDHAFLEAEVERLRTELTSKTQEVEQLKSQISALQVEKEMLTMQLEHQKELNKHKDEIILLQRSKMNL